MRAVVTGGAGAMGRFVVRTLWRSGEVDEITVADRDVATAEALADHYGPRVKALGLDVSDVAALDGVVETSDVVVNAAGPFFRTGAAVLDAVLRGGGVYIDIDDDPEPTLSALARHDEATSTGATCVIGLGGSPGVTNLLATVAARDLDLVHEVVTAWNIAGAVAARQEDDPVGATGGSSEAAREHFLRESTGSVLQLRDGAIVSVAPMSPLSIEIDGRSIPARTIGHPEAVTMQRRFPGLATSTNAFFAPREIMVAVVQAVRAVAGDDAVPDELTDWRGHLPTEQTVTSPDESDLPLLVAVAVGERNGTPCTVTAAMDRLPPSGMGGATGVPAAIGALLAIRGELPRRPGVYAPEEVVPVDAFFAELSRWLPPSGSVPYRIHA